MKIAFGFCVLRAEEDLRQTKERTQIVAVKPNITPLRLVYCATFMMFLDTLVTNSCFLF